MANVYIGLGTNIEPRLERINDALIQLDALSSILRRSAIYEAAPVGFTEQSHFLNAVVMIDTHLEPEALLRELREMETALGRHVRPRWHEREIDFDILLYDNQIINSEHLRIPHPELHHRKFVLVPLAEIAPDIVHPVLARTISELNEALIDPAQSITPFNP